MPDESHTHHSSNMRKLVGVSAIALLCAVGSVGLWRAQQNLLADYTQQQPRQQTSHPKSYSNVSGSYLAARFAASEGKVERALSHISRAVAFSKEPQDDILSKAYRLSLVAGDLPTALYYAEKLPESYEDPLLSPDLLRVIVALKEGPISDANNALSHLRTSGINQLFMPFIRAWVEMEHAGRDDFANLLAIASEDGEFQSLLQYQLALIFDASGDVERAAMLYDAVADSGNLSHRILMALANFYQRQGDDKKLQEIKAKHFEQSGHSLTLNDDGPLVSTPQEGVAEIFYGIGSILYALQAYTEAEVPLQLAHYLRPDFPSVQLLRGNLKDISGKYDEAIAAYSQIKDHPIFTLKAKLRIALAYDAMGETGRALAELDKLIARYPDEADIQLTKGDILRSNNQYDEAIRYYSHIIDRLQEPQKKHWAIFYARGICFERTNRWPKAEADFLEALRLEADQPDVLNYLGYSWLIQGKHISQAKEMIEKAMAARPRDAHIIDSMGWALYHLGQFEEARKHLEQAIDLSPRDPTLNEHLGDIYWQLGLKLQARYQWERALFYNPVEPGQAEGLQLKLVEGLEAHAPSRPRMAHTDSASGAHGAIEEANAPNLQSTQ